MNWFSLVLGSLAVYRLARMIAMEDGPFNLFMKLRSFWGDRLGWEHWISQGFLCPLCLSFWIAGLALLAPEWLLQWFGLAGAVSVIHLFLVERR